MKYVVLLLIGAALILSPGLSLAGGAPHEVAGFRLGSELKSDEHKLMMDTILPIRHLESLKEIEIKPIDGFKSGMAYYGTCTEPNRLIRIKFKFADPSERFYNKLLDAYKKKFGEPTEWRGDSFQVVQAWKWSFTDEKGNTISLILQHNTEDSDEKLGNIVKMTMTNLYRDELACFEKKHPDTSPPPATSGGKVWDIFIPR